MRVLRKTAGGRVSLGALALALCALASLFGTAGASASAPAPPSIGTQWVTDVTPHNAVLHAEINPNGSLTKYKLQIDTTGHFKFDQNDTCALHPPGVACGAIMIPGEPLPAGLHEPPEGSIPAGSDPVEVSADLANIGATLEPETTYYYRAIAASDVPEVEGPTQTFTTPPDVPGAPIVTNVGLSGPIKTNGIAVHATIDPHGLDTTYELFIYEPCPPHPKPGEATCFEELIYPFPAGTIEAAEGRTTISVSNLGGASNLPLQPGTYYKWKLKVENEDGPVSGPAQPFVTRQRPSLQSESVSGLTETSATLNAQITPGMWGHEGDEFDEVGAYYQFQLVKDPSEYRPEISCPDLSAASPSVQCFGPSLLEGLYGEAPPAGPFDFQATDLPFESLAGELESQAVSLDLHELEPGTTYHYRIIAVLRAPGVDTIEWEAPPVYGADREFTTPEYQAPTVTTSAGATDVEQTTAKVGGTVNPNSGYVTACKVEYGTTTGYGLEKACDWLPGEGDSPVVVTAVLSGLAVDTTYHYRLVATNAGGTSMGADQTFSTRPYSCAFSGGSGACRGGAPGNPKPKPRKCGKGKVRKHGKCVRKKHARHRKNISAQPLRSHRA